MPGIDFQNGAAGSMLRSIGLDPRAAAVLLPALLLILAALAALALRALRKKRPARRLPPKARDEGQKKMTSILSLRLSPPPEEAAGQAIETLRSFLEIARDAAEKTGGVLYTSIDGGVSVAWGDLASTGSAAHDALNAVRAALLVRLSLAGLNKSRLENGRTALSFFAGISSGASAAALLAPEYPASRVLFSETGPLALRAREAAGGNGVDIALSAKTWRLVKDYVICEEITPLEASGAEPCGSRLFAAVNLRALPGSPQIEPATLSALRKTLTGG
jgi:class 3 adenylate cyclase